MEAVKKFCDALERNVRVHHTRSYPWLVVYFNLEMSLEDFKSILQADTSKLIREAEVTRYFNDSNTYFLLEFHGGIDLKIGTRLPGAEIYKVKNVNGLKAHLKDPSLPVYDNENSFYHQVSKCRNQIEVIELAEQCNKSHTTAIDLFRRRPVEANPRFELKSFRPWQSEIIEELKGPADDRKIIWIYDKEGGKGKTKFANHFLYQNKDEFSCVCISQCGGMYHFATLIDAALCSGWNGFLCIFDLPRDYEEKKFYAPLEKVKDQVMNTQKYEGKTITIPQCPHVYIFANFLPDVNKLSKDRWVFRKLKDDGTAHLMTWDEVAEESHQNAVERSARKRAEKLENDPAAATEFIRQMVKRETLTPQQLIDLANDLKKSTKRAGECFDLNSFLARNEAKIFESY
jgi:hypothetical protein